MKHVPVLLNEVLEIFDPKPGQIYIDCTFGGGGHSQALLELGCTVIAIDRDIDAKKHADALADKGYPIWFYNRIFSQIEHIHQQWMWEYVNTQYTPEQSALKNTPAQDIQTSAEKHLSSHTSASIHHTQIATDDDISDYFNTKTKLIENMIFTKQIKQPQIHGILADFGLCTHQLFNQRGFSFKSNDFLDMRMGRSKITASDILNKYSEEKLADMFFFLSDEKQSRLIARKIVQQRAIQSITHMFDLLKLFPAQTGPIHPATKILQALRIEVNQELKEIHQLLSGIQSMQQDTEIKLICISFHSGEDRIIKNIFNKWTMGEICSQQSKKPIEPTEYEIKTNPASRSAKLRYCTRIFKA